MANVNDKNMNRQELPFEGCELVKENDELRAYNLLYRLYFFKLLRELKELKKRPLKDKVGIKEVIYAERTTVVRFGDGSRSVVRCAKGDPYDARLGFALAMLKAILGAKEYKELMRACVYENENYLVRTKADKANKKPFAKKTAVKKPVKTVAKASVKTSAKTVKKVGKK